MVYGKSKLYFILCALAVVFAVTQLFHYSNSIFPQKKKSSPERYIMSVDYECAASVSKMDLIPNIKFIMYIISHDSKSFDVASQWSKCKPWARVVQIPTSPFFESIVYKESILTLKHEWESMDFVGIATYRSLKFSPLEKLKLYLELAYHKPYDAVPLYTTGENMMQQAVGGHGAEFSKVWFSLLQSLGYNKEDIANANSVEVFLRNAMIIRPVLLEKLAYFMTNAMDSVVQNATLSALFERNANYREAKYRKKVAQRVFKTDYYQWHPFIFERLPVYFLHQQHAAVYGIQYQTKYFDFQDSGAVFNGL
jgi:hypothetical protein